MTDLPGMWEESDLINGEADMTDTQEAKFYVQIKSAEDDSIQEERGPFTEHKAIRVASGMDINMSDKFYTEIVEHD